MREGITIEGAQAAKHQEATKSKWKFFFFLMNSRVSGRSRRKKVAPMQNQQLENGMMGRRSHIHPISIVTRKVIHLSSAGEDQMLNAPIVSKLSMKLLFVGMKGNKMRKGQKH